MHLPAAAGTPLSANSQTHNGTAVVECFLHFLCKESALFPSRTLLPPPQTTQQRKLYIYSMVRERKLLHRKYIRVNRKANNGNTINLSHFTTSFKKSYTRLGHRGRCLHQQSIVPAPNSPTFKNEEQEHKSYLVT